MKNQSTQLQMNPNESDYHKTITQISHILNSFSARKISPQTIADVLRAQIFESNIPVDLLSKDMCNRILAAITTANSLEDFSDIIHYISSHREFPKLKTMDIFAAILKTPEKVLLNHGTSYYKTEMSEKGTLSRTKYFHSILDVLKTHDISDTKMSFIIEWVFERALTEATLNKEKTDEYILLIKYIVENMGTQPHILSSFIYSMQKDISYIMSNPWELSEENKILNLQKTLRIANNIFHAIVTVTEKNASFISKNLSLWIAEIPLRNEEERFFKESYWSWIRCLSGHAWSPDLQKPPTWVVEAGSSYCASIFQIAPGNWLEENAFCLLERVYQETLIENFRAVTFHYDYVEFLTREMRKKSQFFATQPESTYALQLLSRLTRSEKKIHHYEIEKSNNTNKVTKALAALMRLSKKTAG